MAAGQLRLQRFLVGEIAKTQLNQVDAQALNISFAGLKTKV